MTSEHVGQSKASPYCFVLGVKILSCNLTVGNLISDIVAFRILSNISDGAPLQKQSTVSTYWLFLQKSPTTDFQWDSKCRSDLRCCECGMWYNFVEFVAASWCTTKWSRFNQTMRNFTLGDLGIPLVMIWKGASGLKKTRVGSCIC